MYVSVGFRHVCTALVRERQRFIRFVCVHIFTRSVMLQPATGLNVYKPTLFWSSQRRACTIHACLDEFPSGHPSFWPVIWVQFSPKRSYFGDDTRYGHRPNWRLMLVNLLYSCLFLLFLIIIATDYSFTILCFEPLSSYPPSTLAKFFYRSRSPPVPLVGELG